jgi:acyl-CoA thioester hydrolase
MELLLSPDTVQTSFHVRYAETDAMGVVHHANYLVWFEEARSAFLRAKGASYSAFEADGMSLAVSEAQVRYLAPARYDRLVTVQCRVDKIQSRKMHFSYTVIDVESGQVLVTGTTQHVCITSDGKVTRIPEKWRKQWLNSGQPD